jgi:hypothetical protein
MRPTSSHPRHFKPIDRRVGFRVGAKALEASRQFTIAEGVIEPGFCLFDLNDFAIHLAVKIGLGVVL